MWKVGFERKNNHALIPNVEKGTIRIKDMPSKEFIRIRTKKNDMKNPVKNKIVPCYSQSVRMDR